MTDIIFLVGMVIFFISGIYFYFLNKNKKYFNSALLISLITLISYILMWQGSLKIILAGEPIFWSRWLFYIGSCPLLMFEISKFKKMKGPDSIELMVLTAVVMFSGFLAAWNITNIKWIYFAVSSIAYIILLIKILTNRTARSAWINFYIYFGWTLFPVVFILAPTGVGVINSGLSNIFYLILDILTKVVFSIHLSYKRREV